MPIPSTVLIIEDEDTIRDLLHEVLDTYGYSVITAATVQEAEEIRQRLNPEVTRSSLALPAVRTGSVRFLAKPFDLDDLLAVVQALLKAK